MFLSKKIAKLAKKNQLLSQAKTPSEDQSSPEAERPQRKTFEEKRKVPRYRFKQIPPHSKYVSTSPVYSLHGVKQPLSS